MKATKTITDRYMQLRSIENDLECMVQAKAAQLSTARAIDYDNILDEIDELKQTIKDISRAVVSFSSTFELQ